MVIDDDYDDDDDDDDDAISYKFERLSTHTLSLARMNDDYDWSMNIYSTMINMGFGRVIYTQRKN
jgi:hypothetical protein